MTGWGFAIVEVAANCHDFLKTETYEEFHQRELEEQARKGPALPVLAPWEVLCP